MEPKITLLSIIAYIIIPVIAFILSIIVGKKMRKKSNQ